MTVDRLGHVYTTSGSTEYVMRWSTSAPDYESVAGREDPGSASDSLSIPGGLCFDEQDNLYVVDIRNHRVQRFDLDPN